MAADSRAPVWQLLDNPDAAATLSPEDREVFYFIRAQLRDPAHNLAAVAPGPAGVSPRLSRDILDSEWQYIDSRASQVVLPALTTLLKVNVPSGRVPRIAVCASGGGYRAMLGTVGFSQALQETGFYNAISYYSTLSGSTWALSSTLSTMLENISPPAAEATTTEAPARPVAPWDATFWQRLVSENPFFNVPFDHLMSHYLWQVVGQARSQGRPLTLVDFYGLLLSIRLIGRQQRFSQARSLDEFDRLLDPNNPTVPFPIFTCISGNERWIEMNPLECGFVREGIFIPPKTLGMRFGPNGSFDHYNNEGLYLLQGIWGSAFAASYLSIVENYIATPTTNLVGRAIRFLLQKSGSIPHFTASIRNFAQYVVTDDNPAPAEPFLDVKDAGAGVPTQNRSFNLPFPPLLERENRQVDIIIALDMSADAAAAPYEELKKAGRYFTARFPNIPVDPGPSPDSTSRIRVLIPVNRADPWVIYLPIKNWPDSSIPHFDVDAQMSTMSFQYDGHVVQSYWALIKEIWEASLPEVLTTIRDRWNEHHG